MRVNGASEGRPSKLTGVRQAFRAPSLFKELPELIAPGPSFDTSFMPLRLCVRLASAKPFSALDIVPNASAA
jgi:hypothetical protein